MPEGIIPTIFDNSGIHVDVRNSDEPLDSNELSERLRGYDGMVSLLTDRINATVLEANPQLRVISNVAVGYDNIDVETATRLGMAVTNTPDVLTETTADLALALMLGVARRLPEADAFVRSLAWQRWELMPSYLGTGLHGETLGILGMGRIGRAVARRAVHGFGMKLLYASRNRMTPEDEREFNATYVDIESLLRLSDVVSLHMPLTPETHHVLNREKLAIMRPSAILVNTARGPLVDEAALAQALAAEQLWGAGLDVFEDEPCVHPQLLALQERVVLAPHLGSATSETRRWMVSMAANDARAVLSNNPPQNPVPQQS